MNRSHRFVAVLLNLLGTLLVFGAVAPAASAHAALLQTTPGDAELLQHSPAEVTLKFGERVGTGLGGLRVLSAQGQRVDTGQITQTGNGSLVHLRLRPALSDGSYVVIWRVVSADSHPVSGAFTFSVGQPSLDQSKLLGRGNLTKFTAVPRAPGIALGVTRLLGFIGLVLLLGGGLFCLLLWPAGLINPAVRRLLTLAAATEAVVAGLAVGLEGSYAAGLPLSSSFDSKLIRNILGTQYGVATITRLAAAAFATVLLIATRRRGGRPLAAVLTGLGVICAITWSAAGHAGVGQWEPYTVVLDVSHLVSVSAWVGGLVMLTLGLRGRWSDRDSAMILPGWSRLATWSVGILVASGTFATVREVGQLSALFSTTYGRLLLGKYTLVGLMLLFGLAGRAYVRQHYTRAVAHAASEGAVAERLAPDLEEVAGLKRSVSVEAALAAAVLTVTAILVNTTPAKSAYAPPYTGKSVAGPLTVAVDVYPARKGLNGVHLYTVGAGGRTVDVAEVTGDIFRGNDKITMHLKHESLGHSDDLNVILPATGKWTIELQIRVSDTDSYPTTQTFVVH